MLIIFDQKELSIVKEEFKKELGIYREITDNLWKYSVKLTNERKNSVQIDFNNKILIGRC